MAQDTLVFKLGSPERSRLKTSLQAGVFEYREVPHAEFSVKGEGVVATLYRSGKLVVQGGEAESFVLRYLEDAVAAAPRPEGEPAGTSTALCRTDRPLVGSDECGKGDYFGPLVVCAVRVPAELRAGLEKSEVVDSKKLSDAKVLRLTGPLEQSFEHAVELLDPADYNREYARENNLNELLADLHERAIRAVARPGDAVLVDRFCAPKVMAGRLKSLDVELFQEVRAEREPAVAAASVIARAAFLERLQALSEEYVVDLHKGAGEQTDRAGAEFIELHGCDALTQVAKLHFKNTSKIVEGRG